MRELEIAAKVLPLYFNTLSEPVDFRPSRVKRHRGFYKHML